MIYRDRERRGGRYPFFLVKRDVRAERKIERRDAKKSNKPVIFMVAAPLSLMSFEGWVLSQDRQMQQRVRHSALTATPPAILLCEATVRFVTHTLPRGAHGESPNPQRPSIPHCGRVDVVVVITRQLVDVFVDRTFAIGGPAATASPPATSPSNVAIA